MKTQFKNLKTNIKHYAPYIVSGIVIGVAVTAIRDNRRYHPKDKIAIQFPEGTLEMMQDTGKGVAVKYNQGWLTIKHVPND